MKYYDSPYSEEPDWDEMSDEQLEQFNKYQQMRNDWDNYEEDYDMYRRSKPYDFKDFDNHQNLKRWADEMEGESARNAYLSGENDEAMKKRQSRYNKYRQENGLNGGTLDETIRRAIRKVLR